MKKFTSRRRFLLTTSLAALAAGGIIAVAYRGRVGSIQANNLSTLSSLVDTIIPSGVTSPDQYGALDIGIDNAVRKLANKNTKFHEQIRFLVSGIEKNSIANHQRKFSALTIDEREALITTLLTRQTQQQLKRAIRTLRTTVMRLYYTSPQGRTHLGYTLPSDYPNY